MLVRRKTAEGEKFNLWDVTAKKIIWETLFPQQISSVNFNENEKTIEVTGYSGQLFLKNIYTGEYISLEDVADFGFAQTIDKGKTVVLFNSNERHIFFDITGNKAVKKFTVNGYPHFNKDGSLFAVKSVSDFTERANQAQKLKAEEIIEIRETSTNKLMKTLKVTKGNTLSLSPMGKYLVIDSRETSEIWNVETEQLLWQIPNKPFQPKSFNADGTILAFWGEDNSSINLFDTLTGKLLKTLKEDLQEKIRNFFFSPTDKIVLVTKTTETIKIWDSINGKVMATIKEPHIGNLKFSSDGKNIISGWFFNTPCGVNIEVKFWDVETGKEIENKRKQINALPCSSTLRIRANLDPESGLLAIGESKKLLSFLDTSIGKIIKQVELDINEREILKNEVKIDGVFFSAKLNNNSLWGKGSAISLINNETQKTIANLYWLNKEDWAVIAPDGRFDASEGALKLMHYVYGLEVINLEQLKEMYYEPGLLQKLLGYSKEPLRPIAPLKDVKLYPEIIEQNFDEKTGKLTAKLKNRGGGIGETRVLVNDSTVIADARNKALKANPNVAPDAVVTLTVDLPEASLLKGKENKITVITSNYLKEIGKGNIQSRGSEIVYLDKDKEENVLPSLYAIVGGVSDYEGEQIDLRFAAKDAEDFASALSLGARRLFCDKENPNCLDKVQIKTLSTSRQNAIEQPTKVNFRRAFAEIAAKAKPEDIVVVYLAGHGVTLGTGTDTYFYLTKEARSASKANLETNFQTVAISNAELTDWLTPNQERADDVWIKAQKRVLILDTCAAGNFAEKDNWRTDRDLSGDQIRAMDFLKGKTGTFILMGSSANQPSYESNKYGQGLLTFALLEGMKGQALQKPTENIDVRLLFDYAEKRVPELGKDVNLEQKPIIEQPSGNTFLIGQMTDTEKQKINLPQPKPLMLRPLLTNPETGDDDLKLIPELRKRLDAESSYEVVRRRDGGEPSLIYVDDDNFPGGVRVTGIYTIESGKVRVKAFLRRDGKTIATLPEIFTSEEKVLDELLHAVRSELSKIKHN